VRNYTLFDEWFLLMHRNLLPNSQMAPRILVTGATGKQGGACLNALLATPGAYELYALTRTESSPAAQALAARGVHIVEGNLDAPEAAFAKIPAALDGVFYVSVFSGRGQSGTTTASGRLAARCPAGCP
jgi:uncharacterized protein YbjT (DUF2867 family)